MCTYVRLKSPKENKLHRRNSAKRRYYCDAKLSILNVKKNSMSKNMYTIQISYVNENDVKSKIYKLKTRITQERKH